MPEGPINFAVVPKQQRHTFLIMLDSQNADWTNDLSDEYGIYLKGISNIYWHYDMLQNIYIYYLWEHLSILFSAK